MDPRWYVIHTYAGYENKVKSNLEHRIESMDMGEMIFRVVVPTEDVMEIKGGKKEVVQKKMLPGYILVNMELDDDSWYVVRNTPGVTGFVGNAHNPVPLRFNEAFEMLKSTVELEPATTAKGKAAAAAAAAGNVEIDFEVPGQAGAPAAKFQVLVEPNGVTGSYVLIDKITGSQIATIDQAGQVAQVGRNDQRIAGSSQPGERVDVALGRRVANDVHRVAVRPVGGQHLIKRALQGRA